MRKLYSKQPGDILESFLYLKHTVQTLEEQAEQGQIQAGFYRKAYQVQGLPVASQWQSVPCVEYLTHGVVADELPRQVRYGYRASNGYSESVTYRDKFWTRDGHVHYELEIRLGKNGSLQRSESYYRNGETVSSEITRTEAPRKQI